MTPEQGLIELERARQSEYKLGWKFIRLLISLVDEYGRLYIYKAADHLGCSPKTLDNDVSLGRNPASHYAEELGLSRYHVEQVVGLSHDEAESWLLLAAENGLSARALGAEIRKLSPRGESKATGSATLNENGFNGQTHHETKTSGVAPRLLAADDDDFDETAGCTVYDYEADEVPFETGELIELDDPTAFQVAEYIVEHWGTEFAAEVVQEIGRWY